MPQFYDLDDHLQNGYPNFTVFTPISATETQIYSLDKALRRGYPHFSHISGIFTSSCTYLGYLGPVFSFFWACNYCIFLKIWCFYYRNNFISAFFFIFFLWKANNVLDCFLYLSLKDRKIDINKRNISVE